MRKSLSDIYRKWLVKIVYRKKAVYCVWGEDMDSKEGEDLLLVDEGGRLIVFLTLTDFRKRIGKCRKCFFDRVRFGKWVREKNFSRSDASLYIDILQMDSFAGLERVLKNKGEALALVDVLNFINDFNRQTRGEDILKDKSVRGVWDLIYDVHLWVSQDRNAGMRDRIGKLRNKVDVQVFKDLRGRFIESFSMELH